MAQRISLRFKLKQSIRSPDRPARSQSLYRLTYPDPQNLAHDISQVYVRETQSMNWKRAYTGLILREDIMKFNQLDSTVNSGNEQKPIIVSTVTVYINRLAPGMT
jgi:hypothetical protein